jgi:predicted GIY-YIG superfamily endonuclease
MFVYLINAEGTNKYKIGVSKNTKLRLKALQTGSSERLTLIKEFKTNFGYKLEGALHRNYASKQVAGEWFELSLDEVAKFLDICQVLENNFQFLLEKNTYVQDKKNWY